MTPDQINAVMMGVQTMHRQALEAIGPHVLATRQLPDGKFDSLFLCVPENATPDDVLSSAWETAWEGTRRQLLMDMAAAKDSPLEEGSVTFDRVVYMTLVMRLMSGCQFAHKESLLEQKLKDPNSTPSVTLDFTKKLIEKAKDFFPNSNPDAVSVTQLDDQIYLDVYEKSLEPDRLGQPTISRATQTYALAKTSEKSPITEVVYIEKDDTKQAIMFYVTAEIRDSSRAVCRPLLERYANSAQELAFQQAADALLKIAEPIFEEKRSECEEGKWQLIAVPQTSACIPFLLQDQFYPDEPKANLAIIRSDAFLLTVLEDVPDDNPTQTIP